MGKPSILVIEDEADIRELICHHVAKEGYGPVEAVSAEKALELLKRASFDLVLLDRMLPGMDGFELLRRIKADPATAALPVILVTARTEDSDIVAGLELGADDYVCKPFSPKVLMARVRARLRESGVSGEDGLSGLISAGGIRLDPARHELRIGDLPVELTATEFALLEYLMRSPGHVFSRSRLIDAVHGPGYPVTDRSVDVQILGLRKKLGSAGDLIETVRGVGYRLRGEAQR